MALDDVLTHELVFKWDDSRRKLFVLDGERHERQIAEIDYTTLDGMSWPEASIFIGNFVTLLVPALRERYSAEFASNQDEG